MAMTNGRLPALAVNRDHEFGPGSGLRDPILQHQVSKLLSNALSARQLWTRDSAQAVQPDARRNLEDECGWPTAPSPELYKRMYDYDSLASRWVEFPAKECWQVAPDVYETDKKTTTAFETDYDELSIPLRGRQSRYKASGENRHPLVEYWQRADILSRVGQYSVMYYGLNDGIDPQEPVAGFKEEGSLAIELGKGEKTPTALYVLNKGNQQVPYHLTTNASKDPKNPKKQQLNFIRVFPEAQALITRWENNRNSPRFCKPVMYRLTTIDPNASYSGLGLPLSTVNVHWTRITHVADTHHQACSSEDLAVPSLQSVLYDVLDARKVSGASSEGYWLVAFIKTFLETHPQLGGDVDIDVEALQDMLENIRQGSQRDGLLKGLSANAIAPSMVDPTPYHDLKIKRICIRGGYPERLFEGSERGELSSGQDEDQHSDRIAERQNNYLSPRLVAPSTDQLISMGVLTEPEQFFIEWPPVGTQDKLKQAQVFSTKMQGLAAAIQGQVDQLMPEKAILIEAGFDEDAADQMLEDAAQELEDKQTEDQALADKHGMIPESPPGFQHPEPPPVAEPPQPLKVKEGEKVVFPKPPTDNEELPASVAECETFLANQIGGGS
jgi:hypothetical protein